MDYGKAGLIAFGEMIGVGMDYPYLRSALSNFSIDWEFNGDEYTERFADKVKRSPLFGKKVREEIIAATQDSSWNWSEAADQVNFIGDVETDAGVLESVIQLIWPIVAPNEEPPKMRRP